MPSNRSRTLKRSNGRKVWTERDDELPPFMAELLGHATATDVVETTRTAWSDRRRRATTGSLVEQAK